MGTSFKRGLRKSVRQFFWELGRIVAPVMLKLLSKVPRKTLHAMARGIGAFWFSAIGSSRQLGMDNLDLVYGDTVDRSRKEYFCRESFKNILQCMLDYYYFSFRPEEWKGIVTIDPVSEARIRGLVEKGRGALFCSAHLGNWELLASFMNQYMPTSLLTRQQKAFDRYMVECRLRHRVGTLHDHATLPRDIIASLKKGGLVGFALDRNLRNTKGVITDFLGSPAYTPYFPILFALKSKAPMVAAFMVREGPGYRVFVEEPVEMEPLESREATYRHYTQVLTDSVSKYVREYPDQWFWAHKRWGKPKGKVAY
jgi:Kdo2-lipid IVA lauroyltransferase/acyltransferase